MSTDKPTEKPKRAPPKRGKGGSRIRVASANPTNRELVFVTHYLATGSQNAFGAAVAAGYTEKAAKQAGMRLLRRPRVIAEIAARQAKLVKRLEVKAEDVLAERAKVAFDPEVSPIKVRALELLGKHHQLFVERVDMRVDALRPEERAARAAALLATAQGRLLASGSSGEDES